jgi:hypothetical protein
MKLFKTNKSNNAGPQSRHRRQPSTIIGERVRPEIFSYRAHRGERLDNPQRTALSAAANVRTKVQQSAIWRRLRLAVAALALLALVVDQSLITKPPKVVFEGTNGTSYHYEAAAYAAAAQKLAQSSVFNKTKWTFNTTKLNQGLQQAFPELASVQTSLPPFGNTPLVHLLPGKPTLLVHTTANQTFVVDERGVAVATAKSATPITGLLTVDDQSGVPVTPGQPALPSSTVAFIQDVQAQLASQKINVTSATLPAQSSELDIHIAGQAYFGKFNLQSDARGQAGTFAAVKSQLDAARTPITQYIDVRLPGRAYYL